MKRKEKTREEVIRERERDSQRIQDAMFKYSMTEQAPENYAKALRTILSISGTKVPRTAQNDEAYKKYLDTMNSCISRMENFDKSGSFAEFSEIALDGIKAVWDLADTNAAFKQYYLGYTKGVADQFINGLAGGRVNPLDMNSELLNDVAQEETRERRIQEENASRQQDFRYIYESVIGEPLTQETFPLEQTERNTVDTVTEERSVNETLLERAVLRDNLVLNGRLSGEDNEKEEKLKKIRETFTDKEKERYAIIEENNRLLAEINPNKVMDEEEKIYRTIHSKYRPDISEANTIIKLIEEGENISQGLIEKSNGKLNTYSSGLNRLLRYFVDVSGTPEAEKRNIELLKQLSTKEGYIQFVDDIVSRMLTLSTEMFIAADDQEALRIASEYPSEVLIGYVIEDVANDTMLSPEKKKILNDNKLLFSQTGAYFTTVQTMNGPYYGTLPDDLSVDETMKLFGKLTETNKEKGTYNDITASNLLTASIYYLDKISMASAKEHDLTAMQSRDFSKGVYAYLVRDEQGNEITFSEYLRRERLDKPVFVEERPAEEIKKIEQQFKIPATKPEQAFMKPKFGHTESVKGKDYAQGLEMIDENAELLTPEQERRYEFIEQNNAVIKNVIPEKVMSQKEMLAKTLDPEVERVQNAIQKYKKWKEESAAEYNKCKEELGAFKLDPYIARLPQTRMDLSGTPEAHERNLAFMASLATEEGQTRFAEEYIKEMISKKLSDLFPNDEAELIRAIDTDPSIFFKAYTVCDMEKETKLNIDENLKKLINETQSTLTMGGGTDIKLRYLSSPYYGTLPDMSSNEMSLLHGGLSSIADERERIGVKVKNVTNQDRAFDDTVSYCVYRDIKLEEANRALIAKLNLEKPVYYYEAYDSEGKKVSFDNAVKAIENGKQGYTIQERPDTELKIIEEAMAKAGKPKYLVTPENSLEISVADFQKTRKRLDKFYQANLEFKKDRADIVQSLDKLMKYHGYDIENPVDLGHLCAIYPDKDGNMARHPLFVENPDSLVKDEDILAAQRPMRLEFENVGTGLSRHRQEEILKLFKEGKVFLSAPGDDITNAMQLYTQKDGKLGITKGGSEASYFNVERNEAERLQKYANEAKEGINENTSVDEQAKDVQYNFWKKEREKNDVNLGFCWANGIGAGNIYEKAQTIVTEAINHGLTKEQFIKKMENIPRNIDESFSVNKLENILAEDGTDVNLHDVDNKEDRKELSQKAFKTVMETAYDQFYAEDQLDHSKPEVRALYRSRHLSRIILNPGLDQRENNERIAEKWFNSNSEEKSKLLNEHLSTIYDDKLSDYMKDMTDEQLVDAFPEIARRATNAVEIQSFLNENPDLKIEPEIKEHIKEGVGELMNKYWYYQGRIGLIASPYYAEMNMDALLDQGKKVEFLSKELDLEQTESKMLLAMAGGCCSVQRQLFGDALTAKMGLDALEKGVMNKLEFFNANGDKISLADAYEDYATEGAVYAKRADQNKVTAYQYYGKGTAIRLEEKTDQATLDKIAGINKHFATGRYISNEELRGKLDWKYSSGESLQEVYSELYEKINEVDPIVGISSTEYRNIKGELYNLSRADDAPNERESRESLEKIGKLCEAYITHKKDDMAAGKEVNNDRLRAVRDVYRQTNKMLYPYRMMENSDYLTTGEIKTTIEDINRATYLTDIFKPIKSTVTAEQSKERAGLRQKLSEKTSKEIPEDEWDVPEGPSSGERFEKEFLMKFKHNRDDSEPTPEERIENDRIREAFLHPMEHIPELTKYMNELYKMVTECGVEEAFKKGIPSDAEYVENYESYKKMGRLVAQTEDYNLFCKQNKIPVDSELYEKANQLRKYNSFASLIDKKKVLLLSEMYEKINPEDIKGTALEGVLGNDVDDVIDRLKLDLPTRDVFPVQRAMQETLEYKHEMVADAVYADLGLYERAGSKVGVISVDGNGEITNGNEIFIGVGKDTEMYVFELDHPKNMVHIPKGGLDAYLAERNKPIDERNKAFATDIYGSDYAANMQDELRKNCTSLATQMKNADSIFTWSSNEFAGIRKELNKLNKAGSGLSVDKMLESTRKLQKYADKYIENKKGKNLTEYEKQRLEAVSAVALFAKRFNMTATVRIGIEKSLNKAGDADVNIEERQKQEMIERGKVNKEYELEAAALQTFPDSLKKLSILMNLDVAEFAANGKYAEVTRLNTIGHMLNGDALTDFENEKIAQAEKAYADAFEPQKKNMLFNGVNNLLEGINKYVATLMEPGEAMSKAADALDTIQKYVKDNKEYFDSKNTVKASELKKAGAARSIVDITTSGKHALEELRFAKDKGPDHEKLVTDYLVARTVESHMLMKCLAERENILKGEVSPNMLQMLNQAGDNPDQVKNKLTEIVQKSEQFNQLKNMDTKELSITVVQKRPQMDQKANEIARTAIGEFAKAMKQPASVQAPEKTVTKEAEVKKTDGLGAR